MDDTTKQLLMRTASEIRQLRQANAILAAKVEMIDLFACVLNSRPAERSQGFTEDTAWAIERHLAEANKSESPAGA